MFSVVILSCVKANKPLGVVTLNMVHLEMKHMLILPLTQHSCVFTGDTECVRRCVRCFFSVFVCVCLCVCVCFGVYSIHSFIFVSLVLSHYFLFFILIAIHCMFTSRFDRGSFWL